MLPIVLFVACLILVPAAVSLLVIHARRKQHREWELLRNLTPTPDFSFLEGEPEPVAHDFDGTDIPRLIQTVAFTFYHSPEPIPFFGTKMTVRQAYVRAVKLVDQSIEACTRGHTKTAERYARTALQELTHLKRDHWYVPVILNLLGGVRYAQGYTAEANGYWEDAEQIALEWPELCDGVLECIQDNMRLYAQFR
ncbi:MAG: hypothetical protein K2X80_19855 [Pseudomonadaceae bacterium]|nr:hypothetical protein [Pseudomonadaceae bacterium]